MNECCKRIYQSHKVESFFKFSELLFKFYLGVSCRGLEWLWTEYVKDLPEQVICSAAPFMLCCLVMCAFLNCRRMAISNTFVLYTYTCICICVYEWNLTCKRLRLLSAGEEDQNAYDINKLRKPLQDTFMCVPSSPTNIQISDTDTREGGHFDGSIEYARM